jgi:hypothetical protein
MKQALITMCLLAGLLIIYLYMRRSNISTSPDALFFSSPSQAVEQLEKLLLKEEWKQLAKYYDLSGTSVSKEDLLSGKFFIRDKKPDMAHPGGFWKYREPFSPGFKYVNHTVSENVATVDVQIVIDQGQHEPAQTGSSSFKLIKKPQGWQLLPNTSR